MQLARTREWRESKGWTQQMLADEASVGKSTVVRVELGASVNPRTAKKIADAMEVAIADLQERPPVPLGEAPFSGKDPEEERRRELRDLAELFFEARDLLQELSEFYVEAGDEKKTEAVASVAKLASYGAISYTDEEVDVAGIDDEQTLSLATRVTHAAKLLFELSELMDDGRHDELAGRRRKYKQVRNKHRRIHEGTV